MSSKKVLELKVKTVNNRYWFNAIVDGEKYTFMNEEALDWQLNKYGFDEDAIHTIWDALFHDENITICLPGKKVS